MKRALVVCLVAGGLGGVYLAQRGDSPAAPNAPAGCHLAPVDQQSLKAVTFSGASAGMSASLLRGPTGWSVSSPLLPERKVPVDEKAVADLLKALAGLTELPAAPYEPSRWAELGIDDAHGVEVKIEREGAAPLRLVVGKHPVNPEYFVREPGAKVMCSSTNPLGWLALKGFAGWRNHAIVSFDPESLSRISVHPRGGPDYALRADHGSWTKETAGPVTPFRLNQATASSIAHQLAALTAERFLEPPASSAELLGLAQPDRIEAELLDGRRIAVSLGRAPQAGDEEAARILKAYFDRVDGAVTADGKITVAELKHAAADPSVSELAPVASRLVSDSAAFGRLDVGVYAAHPSDGALSKDDLDWTLRTAPLVPARVEGDPDVYLIAAGAAATLRKPSEVLRDMTLLSFDPEKVNRVTVTSGSTVTIVDKIQTDGGWSVTAPAKLPEGFDYEAQQVVNHLTGLHALRAGRIVEPPVTAAQAGLKAPAVLVELAIEGSAPQRAAFGANVPGSQTEVYVQGSVDGRIYAVSRELRDRYQLGVELFRHRVMPEEPEENPDPYLSLPEKTRAAFEEDVARRYAQ